MIDTSSLLVNLRVKYENNRLVSSVFIRVLVYVNRGDKSFPSLDDSICFFFFFLFLFEERRSGD